MKKTMNLVILVVIILVTIIIAGCDLIELFEEEVLPVPKNFTASQEFSYHIELEWTRNGIRNDDYLIQRGPSINGPWTSYYVSENSIFTDMDVASDSQYFYRISACDEKGERVSDWSEMITGKTTLTDVQIVETDKEALEIGFTNGDDADHVTQDITLLTSGNNETTISWESENEDIISTSGKVNRPVYLEGNAEVILTATIGKNLESDAKTFTLIVIALAQNDTEAVAVDIAQLAIGYNGSDDESSITGNLTLPNRGSNGTSITWTTTNASIVAIDGTVNRPTHLDGDTEVILTAIISQGTASESRSFNLTVKALSQSDGEAVAVNTENLQIGYAQGDTANQVTQDITLSTNGSSETVISWYSNTPSTISSTGHVIRPTHPTGNIQVVLTATITKGSESDTKEFAVTVKALAQSDAEAVEEDKGNLSIGYSGSDNASNVTGNLTLLTTGSNGTSIIWVSSDTSVVDIDGIINRPTYIEGDVSVSLTATIKKGSESETKEFSIMVEALAQNDAESVGEDKSALVLSFADGDNENKVTKNLTLPYSGSNDTTITWNSDTPSTLSNSGEVTRPEYHEDDILVTLTATITKGSESDTKTFSLSVKALTAIVYYPNDGLGSMESQVISSGETVSLKTNDFTREGYAFTNWNTHANGSGDGYSAGENYTMGDKNLTLYAQWEPITYTITYHLNEGVNHSGNPSEFTIESQSITLQNSSKEGHGFEGWYTDCDLSTKITHIFSGTTGNQVLYANWNVNTYRISFDNNGGSGTMSSHAIPYDDTDSINSNTFTRTGYTFGSWNTQADGNGISYADQSNITMGIENVTLYAQWEANTYTVNFNAQGGETPNPVSKTVTYDGTYGSLATVSRTGYTFEGWWTGTGGSGNRIESDTSVSITSKQTLYAKWSANEYTITFNANGGGDTPNPETKTVTFDTIYGSLASVDRAGYDFQGWYTGEGGTGLKIVTDTNVSTASNHTLYAKWSTIVYKITCNLNGGTNNVSNPSTYTIETSTISLQNPSRSGYSFEGWFVDEELNNQVNQITKGSIGNKVLYTKWNPNTYTIAFSAPQADTLSSTSQEVIYDEQYGTLPDAKRTGYTFKGWWTGIDGNGEEISSYTIVNTSTNLTLYAKWTEGSYVVTFDSQGGLHPVPASKEIVFNSAYGDLPISTKEGIYFCGWWTEPNGNGRQITSISEVSIGDDHTLYAYWHNYSIGDIGPSGGRIFDDEGENRTVGYRYWETAPFGWFNGDADPYMTREESVNTAAELVILDFDDWLMPYSTPLYKMFKNLHVNGLGEFRNKTYWSSRRIMTTESDVLLNFNNGSWVQHNVHCTSSRYYFRPIRRF
ncbi:MAG: InlB B-repeat-containing protein [Spirochaetia bacterium]|nr:InlB B-repeat-containing protein [Spirochaetia bacterium]